MKLTRDALALAWRQWTQQRDPTARERLILHYHPLTTITAQRLITALPASIERDDLIQTGTLGLIKALDQFNPSYRVQFQTYAIALIRGAILDRLRDDDWVPRSVRERQRLWNQTEERLHVETGLPPTSSAIGAALGLTDKEAGEWERRFARTSVSALESGVQGGTSGAPLSLSDVLADDAPGPEAECLKAAGQQALWEAVAKLNERERRVVCLYYWEGKCFREIGEALGVSESRAYQLHAQALGRLRTTLEGQL